MAAYDVILDANGDLPIATYHSNGAEVVVQRVLYRMRIWRKEWILDISKGLPFSEWLQQKAPSAEVIGSVMRRVILETPGVLRITRWAGEFIPEQALLKFSADLVVQDGDAEVVASVEIYPVGTSRSNASPTTVYLNHVSRAIVR